MKNIKESGGIKRGNTVKMLVTIEITAGRKDFLLRFFNEKTCLPHQEEWFFDKENGFRTALVRLLETEKNLETEKKSEDPMLFIDRIEVNVNKQPPKEECAEN